MLCRFVILWPGQKGVTGRVEKDCAIHLLLTIATALAATVANGTSYPTAVPEIPLDTVLESKRINMRLDYGRLDDSDAWYLAVTEAF